MRCHGFVLCFLATAPTTLRAQAAESSPRIVVGVGIGGQRDSDRDLGSAFLAAELGVRVIVGRALAARLSASVLTMPGGQGCTCDPGDPPLGVQGTYGLLLALQPRAAPLYWLAGVGYKRGGTREWNEAQSAVLAAGLGWAFGPTRRGALEVRYEHLVPAIGATRALIPLVFLWRF